MTNNNNLQIYHQMVLYLQIYLEDVAKATNVSNYLELFWMFSCLSMFSFHGYSDQHVCTNIQCVWRAGIHQWHWLCSTTLDLSPPINVSLPVLPIHGDPDHRTDILGVLGVNVAVPLLTLWSTVAFVFCQLQLFQIL